jgi:hypothetical protein
MTSSDLPALQQRLEQLGLQRSDAGGAHSDRPRASNGDLN